MVERPLVINQAFGKNWAFYNADCVWGFRGFPEGSVQFIPYSPPFLSLYIYSDSIADLGNTDSEAQFFEGYIFHLAEQYRVLEPGRCLAIHCKDTMRYMSSHGYAGLYDFPGQIVRLCCEAGFLFQRWITIWKDPVIEMQRTKTYGLLHKSFRERAEVTRQGAADYVLIFQKPLVENMNLGLVTERPSKLPDAVIRRLAHQWSNPGEEVPVNRVGKNMGLSIWSQSLEAYTPEFIEKLSERTQPGRLTVIHCEDDLLVSMSGAPVAKFSTQSEMIRRFEAQGNWKFHSRCTLTDGTYLLAFRNWRGEFESGAVKHSLQPPNVDYQKFEIVKRYTEIVDKEVEVIEEHLETWLEPIVKGNEIHPDYVGTNPPVGWRDPNYYSILVWQRYASPVWFDLEGLPPSHPDCWMDIKQTNVLNTRGVKEDEASKHICPLQLDLIRKLILEYTQPGEVVASPYGGIGSEIYEAIKLGRRGIATELKPAYWKTGVKNLRDASIENNQTQFNHNLERVA